jgi:uncharacterized membrane protein YqaE (UPF0057 family)
MDVQDENPYESPAITESPVASTGKKLLPFWRRLLSTLLLVFGAMLLLDLIFVLSIPVIVFLQRGSLNSDAWPWFVLGVVGYFASGAACVWGGLKLRKLI